jgi:hypothetical protein
MATTYKLKTFVERAFNESDKLKWNHTENSLYMVKYKSVASTYGITVNKNEWTVTATVISGCLRTFDEISHKICIKIQKYVADSYALWSQRLPFIILVECCENVESIDINRYAYLLNELICKEICSFC